MNEHKAWQAKVASYAAIKAMVKPPRHDHIARKVKMVRRSA